MTSTSTKKSVFSYLAQVDTFFLYPIIFSLITLILLLASYFIASPYLPSKIPLLYSLTWGQAQLVTKSQFMILPALVVLLTLINCILAWQLHPSQIVLKRILMVSLVLINSIFLIGGIKILTLFV
jgi:hypothetical protein